ncbi:hypothetical protein Z517_00356 [Fonsecaea pedrosoi CBS 271.37]|uniref:Very-long-chain 3-oxoacyl-CoA synthase n=1 Tax=Fonsecaea pedrosoi CBS 271.37 TaxID=1442368 RepID=A0A0D2GVK4_9EURO|nr:uncharacterized protein Z517_00356 [Fonsecaea pedrosoi CBS 271.37]KIW84968.1 hypothetical protein Z517_00356 [Fonsecaea pedrosoi CBS 271.37]
MASEDDSSRPLTSLQSVILTTGPFIFLWSTLRGYVARNGFFSLARPLTRLNNQVYALFSLALACLVLNDTETFHFVDLEHVTTSGLAYLYHLTKFYEYVDVFGLVASGTPVNEHMAFHHITTPVLTYLRVLHASDWHLLACLNCLHHFWMYAYFGGVRAFRPVLRVTGWAQLVGGIGLDVYYLVSHGRGAPEARNRALSIMILTRYAMLYYEEIKTGMGNAQKRKEADKKGKKAN